MKSLDECNLLIHDVILNPDFQASELASFNVHSETTKLD